MGVEEKSREQEYWTAFAETGEMPSLPVEVVDAKGVDYVRSFLQAQYNELTKILFAEVLAICDVLSDADAKAQCSAASIVRLMILSKKRNYPRRDEMLAALVKFMAESRNPKLATRGGLAKAGQMLTDGSRIGEKAKVFADSCFRRMKELVASDPDAASTDEFVRLVISVGWEFVKHRDAASLGSVLALPSDVSVLNEYQAGQIEKLKTVLSGLGLQPLRDWAAKAKEVYHGLPSSAHKTYLLMQELCGFLPLFAEMRKDEILRNLILFWLAALIGKLKKSGNGIPQMLGELMFRAVRADGLENLPTLCWERKTMDPPPEKGEGVFPATVEKLVNGIYGIVKDRYARKPPNNSDELEGVKWVQDRLVEVYQKLPDEKWGNFRIGKLLVIQGKTEEAKKYVLPVVMRNQSQFWAWDALGRLFPEQRRACLARALLCNDEDVKLVRVKKEAAALGLPVEDVKALQEFARDANDLLLEEMTPVAGVLLSRYQNKEGKDRIKFFLPERDLRPVSPGAVRLPRKAKVGDPFNFYLDPDDPTCVLAVRPREGIPWDVLPIEHVVYYGKSKKGNALLASQKMELSCPVDRFVILRDIRPGVALAVRYVPRKNDFGVVYDVYDVEESSKSETQIFSFAGAIRMPHGDASAAFVNAVYISPDILRSLNVCNLTDGKIVCGEAVQLPPKKEVDRFGNVRMKKRSHAISLQVLGGEELVRYKRKYGIA